MMPDIHIEPGSREWYGLKGARQRVKHLVEHVIELNQQRQVEQDQGMVQRFRSSWDRTNQLFAPPTDLYAMHKRLHLPLGRPEPMQPIEQVDPEPITAEAVPEDYTPSGEPLPGTETTQAGGEP